MRFWLESNPFSGEPRYAVEMYGITYHFTRLEGISDFRDKLRGTRWDAFKRVVLVHVKEFAKGSLWVHGKYRAIRYGSVRAFTLIRHKYEIVQFLDTAIEGFRCK